jgi:hypothetical protein
MYGCMTMQNAGSTIPLSKQVQYFNATVGLIQLVHMSRDSAGEAQSTAVGGNARI